MLRGAYSQLNYFSKFILLITLVFSFLLFSTLLGILMLVPFFGSDVISLLSAPDYHNVSVINAMKVIQILNMVGGLLLPAIIYLWLCSPDKKISTSLFKPGQYLPIIFSVLLFLFVQPLIGWATEINSYLTLPKFLAFIEEWMKSKEELAEQVTEAFLSTTSMNGVLVNVFMITLLPPFAEEILFRGALAGLLKSWTKNIHIAVFLSAFIFAAFHMQFYSFLPRFFLGIALGYLYFWSGSLWLPIAAHFTNNFLTLMVEFLYRKGSITTNAENFGLDNAAWLTALSFVGVTGILYLIYTLTLKTRKAG